jgi:RHS repeat-associated protein
MNVAASTRATLIPDLQGSIIGLLDANSGTLTKFGYQAYGESASPSSSFGYTGQRIDPETGLYYYRARMYMPGWGRFMQVDPQGHVAGSGPYTYAGNDPLNNVDPYGLWSLELNAGLFGVTFGIGDRSAQAFATVRFGLTGGGITYHPWADVPVGSSGTYPGNCTYCQVARSYWETTQGSLGIVAGPVNVTVFQYQGSTLVNEYGRSNNLISASPTPGTGLTWNPDISITGLGSSNEKSALGVKLDISAYYEFGTTIPWPSSGAPPQGLAPPTADSSNPSPPAPLLSPPPMALPASANGGK